MNAKRNMPNGGIVSLDFALEGDNPFSEYKIEEYWIDRTQQVERVVLDKELVFEIMVGLNTTQKRIFELLLEGYTKVEIERILCITYAVLKRQISIIESVVTNYVYR